MENESLEVTHSPGGVDPQLHRLKQRIKTSAHNVGQSRKLKIDVQRRGRWFILKGSVSNYKTKLELFSWVPRVNGGQHIIDKLKVRDACGVEG